MFAALVASEVALFCGCDDRPEATTVSAPRGPDKAASRQPDSGLVGAAPRGSTASWLTEITSEAGLDFVYQTGASRTATLPEGGKHLPEIMGAGVALADFDHDGDLDIYLVNGNREVVTMGRGDSPRNRFYRQEPDGRFVDATDRSGLGDGGYGMGVALGDIDNDGHTEVYVTNYGPDTLFRNRGDGTFEDITADAGIHANGWSCSAVFFDYNLDGFLDLFVTQYFKFDPLKPCYNSAGRRDYCEPTAGPPLHDLLFRNNGDRTFTDVSAETGIASVSAAGLGVISEDLNDDGWPDLYVANDAYDNHLWINLRNGTFRNDALIMGVAYNMHGAAEAGMGVLAADLDSDTDLDLFLTHLRGETNTFYRNLGGAIGFSDATGGSGLGTSSVAYTGFGTSAFDIELDGDLDIIVVNGRVVLGDRIDGAKLPSPWDRYAEPNLLYLNDGHGRFQLLEAQAESFSRPIEITRGLAVGDVDADGDLDVLVGNIESPARLYRNDAPRAGHWLTVRAIDPRLNRDAIGARITVTVKDRKFVRTITSSQGYLSAGQPLAHFGLGDADAVDEIEVRWPGGERERFAATRLRRVDRSVRLVRGRGTSRP